MNTEQETFFVEDYDHGVNVQSLFTPSTYLGHHFHHCFCCT